jgi:hypothetical protein
VKQCLHDEQNFAFHPTFNPPEHNRSPGAQEQEKSPPYRQTRAEVNIAAAYAVKTSTASTTLSNTTKEPVSLRALIMIWSLTLSFRQRPQAFETAESFASKTA